MKKTFSKTMKRELEVAFSKHSQPVWVRITKYIVIGGIAYFLWGTVWLWIILPGMFVLGLALHLWIRHKTEGWTKSYGAWDYEKNKPRGS